MAPATVVGRECGRHGGTGRRPWPAGREICASLI